MTAVGQRFLLSVAVLSMFVASSLVAVAQDGGEKNSIAVTNFLFNGEVEDMQWIGSSSNVVFVLTDSGYLYRSTDEGRNWEEQNRILSPGKYKMLKMVVSEADSNRVFIIGEGQSSFITSDGGATWEKILSEYPFVDISLNPRDKNLILATSLTPKCNNNQKDADGDCHKKLYVSEDYGMHWRTIAKYVVSAEWQQACGPLGRSKSHKAIVATVFENKFGAQLFGYWDSGINFVKTEDFFETEKIIVKGGNRFLMTDKYVFVAQVTKERKKEVMLQLSDDCAETFTKGKLPFHLNQHSYTVLDTSEDQVFLHVNHKGDNAGYGHVYISDALGLNYTISLPNNRRDENGKCDFEKVLGLEGTYLANYVTNTEELTRYEQIKRSSGLKDKAAKSHKEPKEKIRTVITFDKGGEWKFLQPPKVDAKGAPINCQLPDCSLNLHGTTSEWGPFYSAETATGLILSTGNVGSSLSYETKTVNTYFSRDGGLEWFEVKKGSRIYEIGDHGGLLLMAKDITLTNVIEFSWDEGMTWQEFQFCEAPMSVDNIIIEPSSRSKRFLVYGVRDDVGVMYSLDFSGYHERECGGLAIPGNAESDYEYWSPSDGRAGERCVLGHKVEYTRRKRDAACYNPVVHERVVNLHHCACTVLDYECDVGFARRVNGGPCMKMDTTKATTSIIPEHCPSGSTYTISNGYRKVAGDTCDGGDNYMPTVFPCPTSGFLGVSNSGWFVLMFIIVLVIGMCMVNYKSRLTMEENLRAFGTKNFGEATGVAKGLLESAKSFVKHLMGRGERQYQKVGGGGMPESAMDYEYNSYPDYDMENHSDDEFDIHDDVDNVAELIPATTAAKPLPVPTTIEPNAPVPKLNAPPSAGALEFIGDDGDAV